jgi:serine/threonine protein kinase
MQQLAANTAIKQYRILAPLGKGGMGEVYLAEDTALGRRVALKILPPEFADDSDRMDRFVREARSASALNHPNIITIYEIGEANGTHFIATEFIDGKTLTELERSQALDYRSILDIATQVASALDEAHSAGIVHRDIKPDNVMIRANGLAKLLDFGIAKLSASSDPGDDAATVLGSQTHGGMLIGTPQFMSPEQARGLPVDHQTDIFSLGVVMHQMLSGQSPFAGDTASDALAAVLTREPARLTKVPAALAEIVSKTLQKDRRDRYRSIKDLLRDLRAFRQESDVQDSGHGDVLDTLDVPEVVNPDDVAVRETDAERLTGRERPEVAFVGRRSWSGPGLRRVGTPDRGISQRICRVTQTSLGLGILGREPWRGRLRTHRIRFAALRTSVGWRRCQSGGRRNSRRNSRRKGLPAPGAQSRVSVRRGTAMRTEHSEAFGLTRAELCARST